MDRHLRGIDHVVVAVGDLDAAAERWRRLGFTLTPRGRHPEWGTANHCIVLDGGYIELLGVETPDEAAPLARRLTAFGEGIFAVALASDDPAATAAAWRTLGFSARGPERLTRRMAVDGEVELVFANVLLPAEETLGLGLFACRHETPEREAEPAWRDHANGARELVSVSVLAEPPDAVASLFDRLFGTSTRSQTDNVAAFHLGRGRILVLPVEDTHLLHPLARAEEGEQPPRFVAVEVAVADLDALARRLEAAGVPHRRIADGLAVPPDDLGGVALEFTEG